MKMCRYVGLGVAITLCIAIFVGNCDGFEYSGYCQKMCLWGRGGNLCKCNAVHFAGKRESASQRLLPGLDEPSLEEDASAEDERGDAGRMVGPDLGDISPDKYKVILQWIQQHAHKPKPHLQDNANTRRYLWMAIRKLMKTEGSDVPRQSGQWSEVAPSDYDNM